jgi:hypothetical protein
VNEDLAGARWQEIDARLTRGKVRASRVPYKLQSNGAKVRVICFLSAQMTRAIALQLVRPDAPGRPTAQYGTRLVTEEE